MSSSNDDVFGDVFGDIFPTSREELNRKLEQYTSEIVAYCDLPEEQRKTAKKPVNPFKPDEVLTDERIFAIRKMIYTKPKS